MDFNMALFEQTINEILPGLTMYVRDVNLPDRLSERYIPGTIILERGFTDASSRVMGMKTTHRFAILSNHMRDLSAYEHGTNWGLFVAASSSHFLILDKYPTCFCVGNINKTVCSIEQAVLFIIFEKVITMFLLPESIALRNKRIRFESHKVNIRV